jgi:hypothetical protein
MVVSDYSSANKSGPQYTTGGWGHCLNIEVGMQQVSLSSHLPDLTDQTVRTANYLPHGPRAFVPNL